MNLLGVMLAVSLAGSEAGFSVTGEVSAVLYNRYLLLRGPGETVHCNNTTDRPLGRGDVIRASGFTYVDKNHQTQNVLTNLTVIGHNNPDAPATRTLKALSQGACDDLYCCVSGVVTEAFRDENDSLWSYLVIQSEDAAAYVAVPDGPDGPLNPSDYLFAKIAVTGAVMTGHCGRRIYIGSHLELPGPDAIEILKPRPADPFDAPRLEHPESCDMKALRKGGLRTLEGSVVAVWGSNHILFASANGSIHRADLTAGEKLPAFGDAILVAGRPETDLFHLNFTKAFCRVLSPSGAADSPRPEPIPANALVSERGYRVIETSLHGTAITLEGRVLIAPSPDRANRALLNCDGTYLLYDVSSIPSLADRLEVGSRVRFSGCGLMEIPNLRDETEFPVCEELVLIARTPDDLTVLETPPLWTTTRLLIVILSLLAALIAILVWNRILNRLIERRGRQLFRAELAQTAADLRTEERTRLAAEMHDSLSQSLTGIACQVDAMDSARVKRPERLEHHLTLARRMIASCREQLRNCLWDLRSNTLNERDVAQAIRNTVAPHAADATLEITFDIPRSQLSDTTFHETLCILRELVANAIRHGHATAITIAGTHDGRFLCIRVSDNGYGFDPANRPGSAEGHFGLLGVNERLERLRGTLSIDAAPGRGATFTLTFPLNS